MRRCFFLTPWVLLATVHCGSEVSRGGASGAGGQEMPADGGTDATEDSTGQAGAGGGTAEDGGSPHDGGSPQDGGSNFFDTLDGIWLMGWSGGLRHYSWVRFVVQGPGAGEADFLSGDTLSSNTPYWNCSGKGSWTIAAKPDTVQLFLPASCGAPTFEVYTFLSLMPIPPGGYPKGAILGGNAETNPPNGLTLEAYKFAPSQCDASMTSCIDPFL
jgi:hypothetical protein